MINYLVDSSFLYILLNKKHPDHTKMISLAGRYKGKLIVPYVVLTETAYLFNRAYGVIGVIRFLDRLSGIPFTYEVLTDEDFIRIREIMITYKSAEFDFVDCCIMALSERLHINQVFTLDRRDFGIFRPKHVANLTLLP